MTESSAARQLDIYSRAIGLFAQALSAASNSTLKTQNSTPLLYGPTGSPLAPDAYYSYRRPAAQRTGTLINWNPKRAGSKSVEALDRQAIVARATDLTQNDPHAAGVVDTFAVAVAGSGLIPIPAIDPEITGLPKDVARTLQTAQRAAYQKWCPFADVTGRMSFGGVQYLLMRNLVQHGEFLMLLPMLDDPLRPYSLACQVINPLRLKTPMDRQTDGTINDGVELGEYGQPVAYWIKKSIPSNFGGTLPDISTNFLRIPVKTGHRWNAIHGFVSKDPEQVRGWSSFAPGMKFFKDLNDALDAELVSNIVTSCMALWVELAPGNDPFGIAQNLSRLSDITPTDLSAKKKYYEEIEAGSIMYGNTGETPHLLSANRPGTTFDPFTKLIKKALAMSVNMPYPVLFKDVEGVNYAGFRSAMLDAWRTFMFYRDYLGQDVSQKPYTMLQEEAYLRGEFDIPDFYTNMHALTRADWRGSPKGDIEPIKSAQADIMLIEKNIKTRAASIAERGSDLRATFDQLQEEQEMMAERELTEQPVGASPAYGNASMPPDGMGPGADPGSGSAGSPDDMDDAASEQATADASLPASTSRQIQALTMQIRTLTAQQKSTFDLLEEIREHLI